MRFFYRIQHRLIFWFVLLVVAILVLSGWILHWMVRQSLEAELGRKLIAVAKAASVQFEPEELDYLVQGIGRRIEQRFHERLDRLRAATNVKRIYLFNPAEESLLDTDPNIERSTVYFNLRFYRRELEQLKQGEASASILFRGLDGEPTMTAFVPLIRGDDVVGGVAVDGSAIFLEGMDRFEHRLILIGSIGAIATVLLGMAMSRTITRPLEKLVNASRAMEKGQYSQSIPVSRPDEIGYLSQTMEEMRQAIVERERDLKAMVAGVAHEIRNPLGGIELFAGLLEEDIPPDSKEHLSHILHEINHLKRIVNSFLTFARPHEPQSGSYCLKTLFDEVVISLRPQIESASLRIHPQEMEENIWIWIDPDHLKRIFINLMLNAIEAMPKDGTLTIRIEPEKDRVRLLFEDTGPGIPEDIQEKIFVPFFTTRDKGTGLGLSIVKGLVEANGGTIRLIRSDETGSIFEITLLRSKHPRSGVS